MAIYQEKTQLTQRPLTATELADARAAYNAIGKLYPATHAATELVAASDYLRRMMTERTTDGKPIRSERVPTKDDIGKRVKVRRQGGDEWFDCCLVGFEKSGRFVVQSLATDSITAWQYCIIDEEGGQ
jgi:hypothetical protein